MSKESLIRTPTARAKLAHRKAPYWSRISAGLHIGYKTSASGGIGSWVGRAALGEADKYITTSFEGTLDYDAAVGKVRVWSDSLKAVKTVEAHSMSVSDVCRAYIANLKKEKGAKSGADAEGRFTRLVYGGSRKFPRGGPRNGGTIREYDGTIGRIVFSKLKPKDVQDWRNNQLPDIEPDDEESYKKMKDSVNRNLKTLKAALNYGKNVLHLVNDDSGWKSINMFPDVGQRRKGWLTKVERNRLLSSMQPDLNVLATALLLTGARPGEIANANASDFDRITGKLVLDGKTGKREIVVSEVAREFIAKNTSDRIANAPLFVTEENKRWTAPVWGKLFREAREKANLPDAVLYFMRHSFISEAISQGMNVYEVAKLTGTSVEIVQKHYGNLTPETLDRLNRVSVL
jgi:integrase